MSESTPSSGAVAAVKEPKEILALDVRADAGDLTVLVDPARELRALKGVLHVGGGGIDADAKEGWVGH